MNKDAVFIRDRDVTQLHPVVKEGVDAVDARTDNYVWFNEEGWGRGSSCPTTLFPGCSINIHGMPRGRESAEVAVRAVLVAYRHAKWKLVTEWLGDGLGD